MHDSPASKRKQNACFFTTYETNLGCQKRKCVMLVVATLTAIVGRWIEPGHACAQSVDRPNVILVLADDLGWSDTTLYGTTDFYRTPNIQRLASRGMTFTRAYASSPLCSPTRASILTGLSPARIGITAPQCHLPIVRLASAESPRANPNQKSTTPDSATRFDPKYYSLAEMFRDNGYATGHFGKWHLGPEPYSPLEHGFDFDVPHWPGPGPGGGYVAPWAYPDFDPQTPTQHIEDRMASEAISFIEDHVNQPFFLNYWMFSVHAPFDAKRELIEAYRQRINPEDAQKSPTYAAMIESMDDAVGTLLDTLDRLNIANHTIIVFASDNGGNMYNKVDDTTPTSNRPLRGGKATLYEGGIRGPAIVVHPGKVLAGSKSDEIIQSSDFYPTLLEMLSIQPQAGQAFDGLSIVPALRGQKLNRDAIFTYFPHSPPVPQWLPPAVCVHEGDWKLIRIFHGGNAGAHRYQLFHLRDDIGEANNLAAQYPDRVQAMDQKIEAFLVNTSAARPLPNPNFDPTKYKPQQEGVARIKRQSKSPKRLGTRSPKNLASKPVAGWTARGTCTLTQTNDGLVVESDGPDPYLIARLKKPVATASLRVEIEMSSDSDGNGQVFWSKPGKRLSFTAARSVDFQPDHDGKTHRYQIPLLPSGRVAGIRIDPARDSGTMVIRSVKVHDAAGGLVQAWSF